MVNLTPSQLENYLREIASTEMRQLNKKRIDKFLAGACDDLARKPSERAPQR
jgi:hypothetical protein